MIALDNQHFFAYFGPLKKVCHSAHAWTLFNKHSCVSTSPDKYYYLSVLSFARQLPSDTIPKEIIPVRGTHVMLRSSGMVRERKNSMISEYLNVCRPLKCHYLISVGGSRNSHGIPVTGRARKVELMANIDNIWPSCNL